jgi:hypothetical protein
LVFYVFIFKDINMDDFLESVLCVMKECAPWREDLITPDATFGKLDLDWETAIEVSMTLEFLHGVPAERIIPVEWLEVETRTAALSPSLIAANLRNALCDAVANTEVAPAREKPRFEPGG